MVNKSAKALFAENLNRLLRRCEMNGVELAKALGVSQQNVSQWRNGVHGPDIETLGEIAQILKVPVSALFLDHSDDRTKGADPLDPRLKGEVDLLEHWKIVGDALKKFVAASKK